MLDYQKLMSDLVQAFGLVGARTDDNKQAHGDTRPKHTTRVMTLTTPNGQRIHLYAYRKLIGKPKQWGTSHIATHPNGALTVLTRAHGQAQLLHIKDGYIIANTYTSSSY